MIRLLIVVIFILPVSHCWGLLDNLSISGNPPPITISSATAGNQPDSVVDTSTTYRVETSLLGRKIVGSLNVNTPSGVTLSLQLQAPLGGTSQGSVPLSTTPADLVTGIPFLVVLSGNLQMTYTLSATVAAPPAAAQNVTVTLTLL